MNWKNRIFEKSIDILIVLDCFISILLLSGVIGSESITFQNFSSLFTIVTILSFFYYLLEAIYIWNRKKGMFFPLLKYILLTTITFCAIFALIFMTPFYKNVSDNVKYAYIGIHTILPILVTLEYMVSKKGLFKKAYFTIYLFWMVLYSSITFILGTFVEGIEYPYAFMDPEQLTYKVVFEEGILLFIVMYIYGWIILSIDKKFRKKKVS